MKKSWGRLGATVSAVALLAGGLMGVAGPAQADGPYWTENAAYKLQMDNGLDGSPNIIMFWDTVAAPGGQIPGSWPPEYYHEFVLAECVEAAERYAAEKYPGFVKTKSLGRSQTGCDLWLAALECTGDQILNEDGTACRDKTEEETCEDSGKYWYDNSCNEKSPSENQCLESGDTWEDGECREWEEVVDIETPTPPAGGVVEGADGQSYSSVFSLDESPQAPTSEHVPFTLADGVTQAWGIRVPADVVDGEPVQKTPPPPPCWSAEALNNCPVGGALRFVAPEYAMVGVPVTMYAYVSWRPDANSPAQPTNGTAVIRVDGEDYSGVEFKDGIAEWRFIPETEGMKEFSASGVVSSGISGANAYIDSVPARTYVLEYDPAAYATALKKKRVEVGDSYVITDPNQARSYLEDRYEWSVSEKSDDVCAVYETKKGAVKAKFNGEGKCTVIWLDKESEEEGKYTFIAKK